MGKKFIFNILLNLGLIAMVITAVSSFKKEQYVVVIIALFVLAALIYFKIKLLKQVRELTKDNSKK